MAALDILLPTCNRLESLVMTLAGLAGQALGSTNASPLAGARLVVADQSERPVTENPVVRAIFRVIEARGGEVASYHRLPSRGIAEQRDFLLGRARAEHVLFLDDDVYMEPWVAARLLRTIRDENCGFVGAFPMGLSFRDDVRPGQQIIEFWDGPVTPEALDPDGPGWERAQLHRAANSYHLARSLAPGEIRRYKVAWIASCVLYDRAKLEAVGGFSFWPRLPRFHSGEDVLVQNLLLRRWGGCALLPSGTYHSEVPSTVLNPAGTVDGHALELLPEMIARYAPVAP